MTKNGTRHGGDHELDEEGQELTVNLSEVVAWLLLHCGGRNQRRRAAAPARRKLRLRRLQWLLGHHLKALGVDVGAASRGQGLAAPLRRWPQISVTASGGGSRVRRGFRVGGERDDGE